MKTSFQFVLGFIFVVRMFRILQQHGYFKFETRQSWRVLVVSGFAGGVVYRNLNSWTAISVSFLGLILPFLWLQGIEWQRRRRFQSETPAFFDELILGLKSGLSLRESLRKLSLSHHFGFYSRELSVACLRNSDPLGPSNETFMASRVVELQKILQGSARTIERLQFLRHRYHLLDKFRRKSRHAIGMARAQLVVILAMYFGLCVLQILKTTNLFHTLWFWMSFCLLLVGLVAFYLLTRSFRWKI